MSRARLALTQRWQGRPPTPLYAAALGLGVALCIGGGYLRFERLVAAQEAATQRAELANAGLQAELARLRDRLGVAEQALGGAKRQVAAVSDEASRQRQASEQTVISSSDRIAQLGVALEHAQRELHLTEAQRVTLLARLSKAETDLADGQARRHQVEAGVDQWQRRAQEIGAERDRLRARVGQLEQQLSLRQTHEAPRPVAAAPAAAAAPVAAAAAPPAAEPRVAAVAPPPAARAAPTVAVADGRVAQVERVLASAGVDVKHLFAQYGMRTGEGGPMVAVPRGGVPTLSATQLADLERLGRALPVSAPLAGYRLGSPFGVRGDPMNGHREFHTGIDMLAPYMSPVYATAPGVVTYAGYRDDYGKVVEIDHGNGISSRYAHLHRYVVSVGQRVAAHTQIGFLGSTGRATGPHVHYEVLVNGEPQDPEKFLGLAHLIPAAAR